MRPNTVPNLIFALVAIGIVGGFLYWVKQHNDALTPKPPPIAKVAIADMTEKYLSDSAVGDQQYKGKKVDLAGKMTPVKHDDHGLAYILFYDNARCFFPRENEGQLAKIKPDDAVVIRGVCNGVEMVSGERDVKTPFLTFRNCEILPAEAPEQ